MKKVFLGLVLLLSACFAYSETVILDEKKDVVNHAGVLLDFGDVFYYTERLDEFNNTKKNSDDLFANGFTFELGLFNSDEDGLFDFVTSHTFGISGGRINTEGNYSWTERYGSFVAGNDAKFGNFYFKDLFGPQINFFVLSAGLLFGSNVGYDWMKMDANSSVPDYNYTYKENRVFFDFVFQPYIGLNVGHIVKILISSEFDYPIIRARFIKDSIYRDYHFHCDWFGNDIPTVYRIGAVIFIK